MKNEFNIDVSFDKYPINPYYWESTTFISKIPVLRVNSKCIKDLLTYECIVNVDKKTLLLSDTKVCIVLRLNNTGKITSRSYLTYDKDLDISEYACNLKLMNLDYKITNKKLNYENINEDKKICDYIIKSINNIKDDYKIKYLYYLYFNNVEKYSKDKLIDNINNNPNEKIYKLYEFLNNVKN